MVFYAELEMWVNAQRYGCPAEYRWQPRRIPLPSNRHHRSCGDCLEGKGEKLSGLFCAILCATIVHSAMHTHINRLTGLWIGFCLTGPISLCLDSFLCMYVNVCIFCVTVYCMNV